MGERERTGGERGEGARASEVFDLPLPTDEDARNFLVDSIFT